MFAKIWNFGRVVVRYIVVELVKSEGFAVHIQKIITVGEIPRYTSMLRASLSHVTFVYFICFGEVANVRKNAFFLYAINSTRIKPSKLHLLL